MAGVAGERPQMLAYGEPRRVGRGGKRECSASRIRDVDRGGGRIHSAGLNRGE
jgi:hypothetical protein